MSGLEWRTKETIRTGLYNAEGVEIAHITHPNVNGTNNFELSFQCGNRSIREALDATTLNEAKRESARVLEKEYNDLMDDYYWRIEVYRKRIEYLEEMGLLCD